MKRIMIALFIGLITLSGVSMDASYESGASIGLQDAYAQAGGGGGGGGGATDDTCTSEMREEGGEEDEDGLLTQIIDYIKDLIDDTTQQLYEGVIEHSAFKEAVWAAITLFITVFGAAFLFGIVPLTAGQAFARLLKIGVIASLIGGGGWAFFNDYAVKFFNDGTDELIDAVIGIASGDSSGMSRDEDGTPQPFKKLEDAVGDALSPEMMISAITMFTTGPSGPAMGAMLGVGLVAFIQMLIKALRVYCISLIAKALLFGLAPIFISFILFERTKHIFSGWVNQLVNYSLQPIMLFAFLSFFVVLIDSAIENILAADICWTTTEHLRGSTDQSMFWRFVNEDGDPDGSDFTWDGLLSCIQDGGNCDDFPVSILDILTFMILSHLAYRFSDVVVNIATEIASSTLFLDKLRSGLADVINQSEQRQAGPRR